MSIYVVLLLLVCVCGYVFLQCLNNKKSFLFWAFSLMCLVLGLRGETVGEDTAHFIEVFHCLSNVSWPTIFTSGLHVVWDRQWGQSVEVGYAILNKLVSCFTDDGHVLLFVVSTLTCGLLGRFVYRNLYNHVFLATLFILCDSFYMFAFNAARQMLAVAIVINAYEYLAKKEYVKILLITFAAFIVHNASIVMLAFFVLCTIENKRLGIALICGTAVVAVLGFPMIIQIISVMLPRYSVYFRINYWEPNSLRGTLFLWFVEIAISTYIYLSGIRNREEYAGIIGLLLYIMVELLGQRVVAIGRLTYFFRGFTVFLFPSIERRVAKKSWLIFYSAFSALFILEYLSYARVPSRMYSFCF